MAFVIKNPREVRRSFELSSYIRPPRLQRPREYRDDQRAPRLRRSRAGGVWTTRRLDYNFLERCKEVVCRVKHPNAYFQHVNTEYRLSIMRWSRGAYLDLRKYRNDLPSGEGVLIHQDIWEELLPELIAAVRRVQCDDTRESEQKQKGGDERRSSRDAYRVLD